jgi:Centromere DNA-binding protein complex CBF3 subunit, domain 2
MKGKLLPPAGRGGTPPELTRQVWPEVGEWLDKIEAFRGHQVERMDLAGFGFLRLLRVLRTVVLQDSAILRPLFPDAPAQPTRLLLPGSRLPPRPEEPEDLQIKKVLPVLYDRMRMIQDDFQQSLRFNRASTTSYLPI